MKKQMCLILMLVFFSGCASVGELSTRSKYTETVCTKKLFKEEVCKDVTKEGLHVVKRIKIIGTAAKFEFKKDEEKGEGSSFMPKMPAIKL